MPSHQKYTFKFINHVLVLVTVHKYWRMKLWSLISYWNMVLVWILWINNWIHWRKSIIWFTLVTKYYIQYMLFHKSSLIVLIETLVITHTLLLHSFSKTTTLERKRDRLGFFFLLWCSHWMFQAYTNIMRW